MASSKVSYWLKQISLYQILNGFSKAILVIISRNALELKAYEVSQENIQVSIGYWRKLFSDHPILTKCLNISRVYAEYCEAINHNLEKIRRDDSFLKVQEQGISLFLEHVDSVIAKFNTLIANKKKIKLKVGRNTIAELKRIIAILESAISLKVPKFEKILSLKLELYSKSLNEMKKRFE
jgi:hypothetical protein